MTADRDRRKPPSPKNLAATVDRLDARPLWPSFDRWGSRCGDASSPSDIEPVAACYKRFRVRKYDAAGALLWDRLGPGPNLFFRGPGLVVDTDGKVTVAAGRSPSNSMVWFPTLTRYDRFGSIVWEAPPNLVSGTTDYFTAIALAPDQTISCGGGFEPTGAWPEGLVVKVDPWVTSSCFGDGATLACPCGNDSAPGEREGCLSQLGVGGKLEGLDLTSLSGDTFRLTGSQMPDGTAVYFQGSAHTASVFGDGLICAGGHVTRLGARSIVAGASHFPEAIGPSVSLLGGIAAPGTYAYQVLYRTAPAYCTSANFNLTNALVVDWAL